jgi:hypothetical protein
VFGRQAHGVDFHAAGAADAPAAGRAPSAVSESGA